MKICPRCSESKSIDMFYRDRSRPDGHAAFCKACKNQKVQSWREENRAIYNQGMRDYHSRNRERQRNSSMKKRLGISLIEKERIFETQGRCCAICKRSEPNPTRPFAMDHDHRTGKVRGVLCYRCNRALSYLENETLLKSLQAYLKKHVGG